MKLFTEVHENFWISNNSFWWSLTCSLKLNMIRHIVSDMHHFHHALSHSSACVGFHVHCFYTKIYDVAVERDLKIVQTKEMC